STTHRRLFSPSVAFIRLKANFLVGGVLAKIGFKRQLLRCTAIARLLTYVKYAARRASCAPCIYLLKRSFIITISFIHFFWLVGYCTVVDGAR
ncbi:MAG: hypothetical protein IKA70_07715, partial [Alistipes sp.]|nr:hypothetical protein [Alistipes sp.]